MNPLVLKRFVVTGGMAASLVMLYLLFTWYGTFRVPTGMDTMPDHPPGTLCLIQKAPTAAKVGSVVLIQTVDGGMLLSRVSEVQPSGVLVRHDNEDSRFAHLQGEQLGLVPWVRVHGLILFIMPPEPELPESLRGR